MATAVAKTMTDTRTRSIELARERGHTPCSWAARLVELREDPATGALISAAWRIESSHSRHAGDQGDIRYLVTYDAALDDACCACEAAAYQRPCWHRGLALLCAASLVAERTPAGRVVAERAARADYAAEMNALALAPSL